METNNPEIKMNKKYFLNNLFLPYLQIVIQKLE